MRKDVENQINILRGGDIVNKSEVARRLGCSWKTVDRKINPEKYNKDELKYEIADVMNYCILLCHQIGVDPKEIVLEKMQISAKKYPIEKAKGNNIKYDKL